MRRCCGFPTVEGACPNPPPPSFSHFLCVLCAILSITFGPSEDTHVLDLNVLLLNYLGEERIVFMVISLGKEIKEKLLKEKKNHLKKEMFAKSKENSPGGKKTKKFPRREL